jgi:hypothetical protein
MDEGWRLAVRIGRSSSWYRCVIRQILGDYEKCYVRHSAHTKEDTDDRAQGKTIPTAGLVPWQKQGMVYNLRVLGSLEKSNKQMENIETLRSFSFVDMQETCISPRFGQLEAIYPGAAFMFYPAPSKQQTHRMLYDPSKIANCNKMCLFSDRAFDLFDSHVLR